MVRNLNRVAFFELIWDSLMFFEREGQRMSTLGPHSECNGAYPVDRIRHTVTLSLSDEMEAFEVSKDVGNARNNSPSVLLLSQFSALNFISAMSPLTSTFVPKGFEASARRWSI